MPQPVHLDITPASALALCRLCGSRDLRLTRAAALTAAAAHQALAHGDERAAQQLRWRAQQAATRR